MSVFMFLCSCECLSLSVAVCRGYEVSDVALMWSKSALE